MFTECSVPKTIKPVGQEQVHYEVYGLNLNDEFLQSNKILYFQNSMQQLELNM